MSVLHVFVEKDKEMNTDMYRNSKTKKFPCTDYASWKVGTYGGVKDLICNS